jgi:uroporphyrinogen-III synthase
LHTRGNVGERLRSGGIEVQEAVIYAQRDHAPGDGFAEALAQQNVIVPLFSPRSALRFADALGEMDADMTLLAMSDAVKQALPQRLQRHTQVIAHPTGAEMRKALDPTDMRRNSP